MPRFPVRIPTAPAGFRPARPAKAIGLRRAVATAPARAAAAPTKVAAAPPAPLLLETKARLPSGAITALGPVRAIPRAALPEAVGEDEGIPGAPRRRRPLLLGAARFPVTRAEVGLLMGPIAGGALLRPVPEGPGREPALNNGRPPVGHGPAMEAPP